ncbi:hypothetical protein G7Y79_00074g098880 [Physcia stellaris]|nr:hypothetical protein G7Y79_00074g098880 [Physcia stellaris]
MAAAMPLMSIDPAKGAKYPIKIADQLLRNNQRRKRHNASIELNHKPKLSQSVTTSTIKPLSKPEAYSLSIKIDGDDSVYAYTGSQRPTDSCLLIYDPNTQTLSLDKLDAEFTFNLQSTPTNPNSRTLEQQYPHIKTGNPAQENNAGTELGDDAGSEIGDPNNPQGQTSGLHQFPVPPSKRLLYSDRYQTSPSLVRGLNPNDQRHLHREEADADNEDSDDGGLIIEMEPETNQRRNRFMGAFDGDPGSTGPISLRSAASSMSPAARVIRRPPSVESDRSDDMDVLEDLKLPSPQRAPPPRTPQEEAEEEADLEAELEMALEGEEDIEDSAAQGVQVNGHGGPVGVSHAAHEESSEESEEE